MAIPTPKVFNQPQADDLPDYRPQLENLSELPLGEQVEVLNQIETELTRLLGLGKNHG